MRNLILFILFACLSVSGGVPTITDVTAQQRYPWNGLVDIVVTFEGASNDVVKTTCTFTATNATTLVALPVGHITRLEPDAGYGTNWVRHFVWDTTADVGEDKIDDIILTSSAELQLGGVQLWENGPYWAECNVGATNQVDWGEYFIWGVTAAYHHYDSLPDSSSPTYGMNLSELQAKGYVDETGNLVAEHDAATAYYGKPWRLPTRAECELLVQKCTTTWLVSTNVGSIVGTGFLVTGKDAYSKMHIFLPPAGYGGVYGSNGGSDGWYWSSTPTTNREGDDGYAYCFTIHKYTNGTLGSYVHELSSRNKPYSVRAVRDPDQSTKCTHLALDNRLGIRIARTTEQIYFSPQWETTNTNAIAIVTINGQTLCEQFSAGSVDWTPIRDGTYMFTCSVLTNGIAVGEVLTASFLVDGLNPENPVIAPESGTAFDSSLTITMACPSANATVYYTTDGSDPTTESSLYKRFRIYDKTTVKARAFYDNGNESGVSVAEYALGQCEDPVISLADGTVFNHSDQAVSIAMGDEGTIHYTLDGSEPTSESPVYEGPFMISESTVVKAKVFSDRYFDSQVVTANLTREWLNVEMPVITAAESFSGSKTKVAIACATDGAKIRYTLNGNDLNSHAKTYTGPFYVTNGCTVKAQRVLDDYLNSTVATQTIVKVWGIGDTLGKPDHAFTTGGDTGFVRVDDTTASLGESMRSGTISNCQTSLLETVVMGPGTLSFQWKTSCEDDDLDAWDHAEFLIDGVEVARMDGITDWRTVTHTVTGDGPHVVTWRYCKDDVEGDGEDCCWVAGFSWTSEYTTTQTTDVPVPYAWLTAKCPEVVDEYESYEHVAKQTAANPNYTVTDCYVAGLDPESATNAFRAQIEMLDGVPKVSWSPDLNTNGTIRAYKVYGKPSLEDRWQYPTNALDRFFKVTVEMP